MTRDLRGPQRPAAAALLLAGLLGLASCAVRSQYRRPEAVVPPAWEGAAAGAAPADGAAWWIRFQDPALEALEREALRQNGDLAVAALKVRRARLTAGLAAGDQLPTLAVEASAGLRRPLGSSRTTGQWSVTGTASWELDLWGRLASLRSAADWEAAATEQDRQAAALTLTGTTADLYWKVAYLRQRSTLAEQSTSAARRALGLAQARLVAGAGSGLDVAQAEQRLATQEAAQEQLAQQLGEASRALALLFDGAPPASRPEAGMLPEGELPPVEAGLPAGLVGRRPDLRAAEARLRATLATSDATRAAVYPTFALTGSLGSSSDALVRVLENPVAALGAGLVLPFVNWKQQQRRAAISELDHQEAVIGFRRALYQAFAEVEDALSARARLRARAERLGQALGAARRAERLAELRFREGAVALQTWLDAQEARRQAEVALAENRLSELESHVALVEALGGDAGPAAPAP
jgi:NodT family efflux transporter outer membrane factor (OMF) lipoprotein